MKITKIIAVSLLLTCSLIIQAKKNNSAQDQLTQNQSATTQPTSTTQPKQVIRTQGSLRSKRLKAVVTNNALQPIQIQFTTKNRALITSSLNPKKQIIIPSNATYMNIFSHNLFKIGVEIAQSSSYLVTKKGDTWDVQTTGANIAMIKNTIYQNFNQKLSTLPLNGTSLPGSGTAVPPSQPTSGNNPITISNVSSYK